MGVLHPHKVFERHRPYPGLAGLEVLIPSCRNSACGNECLLVRMDLSGLGCCIPR